jgi:hypothetical protein
VETQDSMRIKRTTTFEENLSSTNQSSLDSSAKFSYQTKNKEIAGATKRTFFPFHNLGRLLGSQCIGRYTSRCFYDNANSGRALTSEEIPIALQFSIKSNLSSFSEIPLSKNQPIVAPTVPLQKRDSSTDVETRKQESQNSMTIPKQESFGTEFFANVLGIDINELKTVMSDRLNCSYSQTRTSRGLFSKDTMKSLLTESSTYETDSTESSSDFEQYSSYSSQTSDSYY